MPQVGKSGTYRGHLALVQFPGGDQRPRVAQLHTQCDGFGTEGGEQGAQDQSGTQGSEDGAVQLGPAAEQSEHPFAAFHAERLQHVRET